MSGLIDINTSYGGRESIQEFSAASLIAELDRTPCSLAFVSSNEGVFDQRRANADLRRFCAGDERLLPAASIHPRDTFVWEDEIRSNLEAGVRLFRIDPDRAGWPVDSVLMEKIVDRLAGTGAALLVNATTPGLPSRVAERTVPAGIPVIFTEARYFPLTELIPLVQRYDGVYIETSRLTSPGGIALCVAEIGAGRLLYGSGTCRYPARIAWQMLERAEISDDERSAIAWRNAASLLGLNPLVSPAPEVDGAGEARQTASDATNDIGIAASRPFAPAIDVHLHDKFPGAPFAPFDAKAYERELERCGVVAGVSSSATAIFHDLSAGNDENAALVDAVPRLKGYVVVDPRYPGASLAELDRLDGDDRWIGVKVHCAHARTATGSRAMANLMAAVAERGKPILVHPLGDDWPEALSALARTHPRLPIIAAHSGYGDAPHPTHDAALRVAQEPNIVIEFCSTYLAAGAIRRGIEAVGVERVLFGSDFPLISLEYMRIAYEEAELTPGEERLILIENALRLFPELATVVVKGGAGTGD
ncbi:MAG: amidohydrolase family protein [Thermomicrobiales bacterium]|nr:amidohydrolase family protein [Thermomicrobiales bacterium]